MSDSGEISAGRRRIVLAVLLSGTFMLLLDSTIVNVALPLIVKELSTGYTAIQWVVSGYALAFGVLLLPAGWLGDRIGHKKVLAGGMAGFTIASVLCGLSSGAGELVAWRVLQGAMAAAINPSILAMIRLLYSGQARGRAFAAYGAMAGAATAIGPLLGGILIELDLAGLSWRPIFLVNLPIGLVAVIAVWTLAPRTGQGAGRLDVFGLLIIVAALATLTFPLTEGRDVGWPVWTIGMFVVSIGLFALFVWWQLRQVKHDATPLLDVRLFRNRSFAAGMGVSLAFFSSFVSLMFALSLYLQTGLGNTPLAAGAAIMPFALGTACGSLLGNAVLAPRIGRTVLHIGATLVAVGIIGLIFVVAPQHAPAAGWMLAAPLFVAGIGSGMIIGPNANIVLSGVEARMAGVASGALSTAQRIGPALGIAIMGILLFGTLTSAAPKVAEQERVHLQQQLTDRMSTTQSAALGHQFESCVIAMSRQQDPKKEPSPCQFREVTDPDVHKRLDAAITHARQVNYSTATQVTCWYGFGAAVVTWLLVFGLPKSAGNGSTVRRGGDDGGADGD